LAAPIASISKRHGMTFASAHEISNFSTSNDAVQYCSARASHAWHV